MARILVVDDEPQILTAVSRGLHRVGHEVVVARSGTEGLDAAAAGLPALVVLDLRLPDINGIEFVRRMRSWSPAPILLLSGGGTTDAKVRALDAGADDFLEKPFAIDELRARVDAALRRTDTAEQASGSIVETGDLRVDLAARTIVVAGAQTHLTPIQWRLLDVLVRHAGHLLTHQQIIAAVWGQTFGDEVRGALRVHVRQLRTRIGDDARHPRYVRTEPGVGYRWIGTEAP